MWPDAYKGYTSSLTLAPAPSALEGAPAAPSANDFPTNKLADARAPKAPAPSALEGGAAGANVSELACGEIVGRL